MTPKSYQRVKLALVVILAAVFGQSVILRNYFIPIALLVVTSLVLLYLRNRVKEVIADERDYLSAGKAALLAIRIYAWLAVIVMFILYGLRDANPLYEPVGTALAFSTCLLMLLYAALFRYYSKT